MKLKVLTFNTWGLKPLNGERWPMIGMGLAKLLPDLVGLQEVFSPRQALDLQKMSGIQGISFIENHSGLLVLSRFSIESTKVHQYRATSPTEPYFRYCQACWISPLSLLFIVTHLSWKPEDAPVRERQVGELIQFIEGNSKDIACILTGDFNASPDSKEMELIRQAGFVDTFGSLYPDETGFTWSHANPYTASHPELPERRIDHIFIRTPGGSTVMIESSEIVLNQPTPEGIFPSDHFGVLTTLRLEGD